MFERKGALLRAGWAALAAVVVTMAARAADAPIPIETFFQRPAIGSATISPDGRHLAVTFRGKNELLQLFVLETKDLTQAKNLSGFDDADIVNVHWINDKRLVFGAGSADSRASEGNASPGLFAVDRDGSDFRQLARTDMNMVTIGSTGRMLDATTQLLAPSHARDSDSVFVLTLHFTAAREFSSSDLLKLDTRSGQATPYTRPGDVYNWAVGPDDVPRVATTREGKDRVAVQYFDGEKWTKISEANLFADSDGLQPVAVARDGKLLVATRQGGAFTTLHVYDPKTKALSPEPVLTVKGFDVDAHPISTREGLLGFRYNSDAVGTYWRDPKMKAVQAKIDKALPATVNVIDVPYRAEVPLVLVHAYSDVDPGQYFLYDTDADKLTPIGRQRPGVDPAKMAPRDFVHVKARDGLDVPAWVTTPKDGAKGPRPTVVMVHGGPYVDYDTWRWIGMNEFLASRGYVVLEPEYRGTTGLGFQHFKSGWKQWGLAMQNDIADVTKWAIAKGIADPKRICIAGASYGGYATLMGLANDPDLYKCGFEWVGVTDIDLMYSATWSDMNDTWKLYGMPVLIGDREKDAAQIKATSPVNVAAKIKQPLLMGYGGYDRRVPLEHGTSFRSAVEKTNKDVEWVVYPEEGHGWHRLKDNVDWWTRVEKFLARNIGN